MLTQKSPEKQNRSPERLPKHKTNKLLKNVQELIEIINSNGISVPPHITQEACNSEGRDSSRQLQELRNLRLKVADYEFQLKKMEQDLAQFKLLSKIQKDRCTKRLRQQLQWQKSKNLQQNRRWQKDFKQKHEEHYQQLQDLRSQLAKCNQNITSLTQLGQQTQKRLFDVQQQLQQKQLLHESALQAITNQHLQEIQQIKNNHQIQLQNIELSYHTHLKQQQKVCEVKLLAVSSERQVEVKATEQIKNQIIKDQHKLSLQLQLIKSQKSKLQQQISDLILKTKVFNKRWEDRGAQLQRLRKDHMRQLQKIEKERQAERCSLSHLVQMEKLAVMKQSYSQIEQLQLKLIQLQNTKQQIEITYKDLLNEVQSRFDQRQSKREDIQTIKEFEQQLQEQRKEKNEIYHQLRLMQLENENNEKLYTRIFTNKRQKKNSMQRGETEWLIRQSQTTDLRTILKIHKK